MKIGNLSAIALVGLLTIGTANAQTAPAGQDPHHPAPEAASPPTAEGGASAQPSPDQMQTAPTAPGGMMGMMSPEMMQMMMGMMAQHHMMGAMASPGTGGMPGTDAAMQAGIPDMTGGLGPDVIYGMTERQPEEMTPERVRQWLQQQLDGHGNPRLTLGEISEAADGSITAEIRTVDGALVQRLAFNRYPGFVRQID